MEPISLVDLALKGAELEQAQEAITRVLERGWFVLGPEVQAFEEELAQMSGTKRAVAVGSGTDALILGMRALGIGPGDEVITPDMTAFPTVAAITEVGATPVLVDIEVDRPLLDLQATIGAISPRTRAVVLVHLYGACADAKALRSLLDERNVLLIEDCAQAQGATLPSGEPVGTIGKFGALSFYPTKNLGALGDGGAIITNDEAFADEVGAWRSHGERDRRYWHHLPARNSRLDDIQAAVLRLRLAKLPNTVERRRALSFAYEKAFAIDVPYVEHGTGGAPHLAVIRSDGRDELVAHLQSLGIGSGIHYPFTVSEQPALVERARHGETAHARRWSRQCLSLPLHLGMQENDVGRVADAVLAWTQAR